MHSIALDSCALIDLFDSFAHQAYLRVQLGNIALDGVRYNEAVEHFTFAVNASTFFYKLPIHSTYDEFIAVCKPGRPDYSVPKAYRPITLLDTMAKILSSCVADDLTYIAEEHHLLPPTHF
ncbi:hypothetical protein BDR07DRAFT_1290669, partial [Suillus spraguei]